MQIIGHCTEQIQLLICTPMINVYRIFLFDVDTNLCSKIKDCSLFFFLVVHRTANEPRTKNHESRIVKQVKERMKNQINEHWK